MSYETCPGSRQRYEGKMIGWNGGFCPVCRKRIYITRNGNVRLHTRRKSVYR